MGSPVLCVFIVVLSSSYGSGLVHVSLGCLALWEGYRHVSMVSLHEAAPSFLYT